MASEVLASHIVRSFWIWSLAPLMAENAKSIKSCRNRFDGEAAGYSRAIIIRGRSNRVAVDIQTLTRTETVVRRLLQCGFAILVSQSINWFMFDVKQKATNKLHRLVIWYSTVGRVSLTYVRDHISGEIVTQWQDMFSAIFISFNANSIIIQFYSIPLLFVNSKANN